MTKKRTGIFIMSQVGGFEIKISHSSLIGTSVDIETAVYLFIFYVRIQTSRLIGYLQCLDPGTKVSSGGGI